MTRTQLYKYATVNDIKSALEAAGVQNASRHPFTTNYLPKVLHDDEQIMAAVFGRRKESEGFFGFAEGMLIATNKRVIFIDHRPGYTTMDEISFDKVSGVNISTTVFYASIILFTKIANYKLSFTNQESAQRFADYIEQRVIRNEELPAPSSPPQYEAILQEDALTFLKNHELAVLSSIARTGAVEGAVIYYTVIDNHPYFVTKLSSHKAENILGNQHASLTVYDEGKLQSLQLQGIIEQVNDKNEKLFALTDVTHPRTYDDGSHAAPIMRMDGSDFVTFRLIPTRFSFTDFTRR